MMPPNFGPQRGDIDTIVLAIKLASMSLVWWLTLCKTIKVALICALLFSDDGNKMHAKLTRIFLRECGL